MLLILIRVLDLSIWILRVPIVGILILKHDGSISINDSSVIGVEADTSG